MAKLGAATDRQPPVLANLNAAAGQLEPAVHGSARVLAARRCPRSSSLGQASVTGTQAVIAAGPTIADLNGSRRPTPELAQNLAIVLHDLDNRSRAVEADTRSPGGKGYTGLEALLQYVFNQTLAINAFGPVRPHARRRRVRRSADARQYATPASDRSESEDTARATGSATPGSAPTSPASTCPTRRIRSACVPDPGGAPPGQRGPATTACKLPRPTRRRRAQSAPARPRRHARCGRAGGKRRRLAAHGAVGGSDRAGGSVRARHRRKRRRDSRRPRPRHGAGASSAALGAGASSSAAAPAARRPGGAVRAARPSSSSTTSSRRETPPANQPSRTPCWSGRSPCWRCWSRCSWPTTPIRACRSCRRRQLKVDIADGSNVVIGNDVREGGFRIGLVSAMRPIELPERPGRGAADACSSTRPTGRCRSIRPSRSGRGRCSALKYVDLEQGDSKQVDSPTGRRCRSSQTNVPVQFDDIFKTFDPPTRAAIQQSIWSGYRRHAGGAGVVVE